MTGILARSYSNSMFWSVIMVLATHFEDTLSYGPETDTCNRMVLSDAVLWPRVVRRVRHRAKQMMSKYNHFSVLPHCSKIT